MTSGGNVPKFVDTPYSFLWDNVQGRESVVGVTARLRGGHPRNLSSIPGRGKKASIPVLGPHPLREHGGRGVEFNPSSAEDKTSGGVPLLPCMILWRSRAKYIVFLHHACCIPYLSQLRFNQCKCIYWKNTNYGAAVCAVIFVILSYGT
jgi:hypothetical protein